MSFVEEAPRDLDQLINDLDNAVDNQKWELVKQILLYIEQILNVK